MGRYDIFHHIAHFLFCCEERPHNNVVLLHQKQKDDDMEKNTSTLDLQNAEQQKAFDLVANTNNCIFITGKAGTGKTTFIKRIQEEINKNFLVLAPTGIAAITVGGQTMHSFFGFPMQAIGPHTKMVLSYENKCILEEIDTIIVDEVSMVRSDMVDGMDRCLRMTFKTNMPFGGKQVIFVGDLFQLPPIIKSNSADAEMLHDLYGAGMPFFYKAFVLKRMNLPKIEFQKVYRQNDEKFLDILNKLRIGEVKAEDLELLNQHVGKEYDSQDFSITLTAFNKMAEKINEQKLESIQAEVFSYQAKIQDEFKKQDAPVPEILRLKVGAQVIFCRNNVGCGYMNGTIGKVSELNDDKILVTLESGRVIDVNKVSWDNVKSKYNRTTHQMETKVVGTFTQYPLKLAWAITIHRSQGMTFDKMHFDLSHGTFLPGQAYVAISRLRSLGGLTLSNPIRPYHVTQNQEVRAFANSFNDIDMIDDELKAGKVIYQYLNAKDYDMASKTCLRLVLSKIHRNDYRNAALMAKRMFDIMLDDKYLLGKTKKVELLKDCSMTANFLNAVICLYSNRYEEAIGYTDMVLSRKQCLEAMFIKGRALYELKRYDEAYDMTFQIVSVSQESEEKKAIDKKLLFFEAKVNEQIGNKVAPMCKELLSLCPEFLPTYKMLRKEYHHEHIALVFNEEDKFTDLLEAFNDRNISHEEFLKMLKESKEEMCLKKLRRVLMK